MTKKQVRIAKLLSYCSSLSTAPVSREQTILDSASARSELDSRGTTTLQQPGDESLLEGDFNQIAATCQLHRREMPLHGKPS